MINRHVPTVSVSEAETVAVGNRDSPIPSSSPNITPGSTPTQSSAVTPVPRCNASINGTISNGTADNHLIGGNADPATPQANGRSINKRYSFTGSMASESMSISKENFAISSRVSEPLSKTYFLLAGKN